MDWDELALKLAPAFKELFICNGLFKEVEEAVLSFNCEVPMTLIGDFNFDADLLTDETLGEGALEVGFPVRELFEKVVADEDFNVSLEDC